MEEQKYLIAIALVEQNNKRLMPLGGKTFAGVNSSSPPPQKEAEKIILDLLLRVFNKSNEGNLKISNNNNGLLLASISFEKMQKYLPTIKSNWINTGETNKFIKELINYSYNLWRVNHQKHEGIIFTNLKSE